MDETELLRLAASLDQGSEHPLAEAIVAEARRRGLALVAAEDFESSTGIGVRGRVEGRRVALVDQRRRCGIGRRSRNRRPSSMADLTETTSGVVFAVLANLSCHKTTTGVSKISRNDYRGR